MGDTNPYPSTHANTNTNTMNARTTACILLVAAVAVLPGVVAQDEACTPLSDVVAAQNLTTLGAVVQAVSANDPDLGSTLEAALGSESGNLTVFGPTDEGNPLTIARAARSPPA